MMMVTIKYILISVCILVLPLGLQAQFSAFHSVCFTIPEIAIMDIEPTTNEIQLSLGLPTEAGGGASLQQVANTKWINYSSSIAPGGVSRRILAQILENLPGGIELNLSAANHSGGGGGTFGTSAGQVSLGMIPQTIIQNIGRAYTGDGSNNGHQLTYSLAIPDYNLLDSDESKSVTVIFTITD